MSRHARFHAITLHVWYILNIISSHLSTEQPKSGFYSIVGPSLLLSLKIRCSEMGTILNIISRYNLVCDTTGNLAQWRDLRIPHLPSPSPLGCFQPARQVVRLGFSAHPGFGRFTWVLDAWSIFRSYR